jgi:hypothetical protein
MLGLSMGSSMRVVAQTLVDQCLRSAGGPHILARSRMLTVFEVLAGLRVGEATGDGHGLAANDVCILKSLSGMHAELGVTIEGRIRDSKTGPGRYVNFVGTSFVSKIPAEKYLRNLWSVQGLDTHTTVDGGYSVERPDYTVIQVSLLGMRQADVDRLRVGLQKEMAAPTIFSISTQARISLGYLDRLLKAKDVAEERRYVNIAGGADQSLECSSALNWLGDKGLRQFAERVAGPLLRATEPGSGALTHMPLQVGSSYEHHVKSMRSAYKVSAALEEPDLELDLQGEEEPHFANHSARRHADRVARETMALTECSVMDLDITFGWNEAKRKKDMQMHYQGRDRNQRVRLARVTMYM